MSFANPYALLWGLLAIPIVLLYWRRVALRREVVATGMIWRRVLSERSARSAWMRWRDGVSLAVQLAILSLMVVALAEPTIPGPRSTVLVIDNSASMNASDGQRTRLQAAKQAAEEAIAGMRESDRMALLSVGQGVCVHAELTGDRTLLRQLVHAMAETDATTTPTAAVDLARQLLVGENHGRIALLTDGCFAEADVLSKADDVELVRVGQSSGNVAVTRMVVRRRQDVPQRCQVLVDVASFSDKPTDGRVAIEADGRSIESALLELAPDDRWQHVFDVAIDGVTTLVAKIECDDGYLADNQRTCAVPPAGQGGANEVSGTSGNGPTPARSTSESDLRPRLDNAAVLAAVTVPIARWPVWLSLAAFGLSVLVAECCLYHRRWIS